jgi:nifR3 family TIM-barrel protein
VVCTEFVRISSTGLGKRFLEGQVVRSPGAALSVQVMGNHLRHLAEATEIVAEAGADIVDLNVGCPAPRAVRKGVGSAMLDNPCLLSEVVSVMRSSTSGWLSAKMRAGLDDAGGAVDIARRIEDAGADFLTVHPRRRVDFYQGVADWRIIAAIKRAVSIPVIGNGDVWYAADALRMRRETGCDGVMIGRGALRNPWIFEQIDSLERGVTPRRPVARDVLAHVDALCHVLEGSHPRRMLGMLKEQVRYLGRAVDDGQQLLRQALRAPGVEELRAILAAGLNQLSDEAIDLDANRGRLERSGELRVASGSC